jgi:hypothetical protein
VINAPKLSFIGSIKFLFWKSPDSPACPYHLSKFEFGIADSHGDDVPKESMQAVKERKDTSGTLEVRNSNPLPSNYRRLVMKILAIP